MSKPLNPYSFCALGFDIIIFFGLGYFLGPYTVGSPIIGALIGTLAGTFIMWAHLWILLRKIKRIDMEQKENE
ncbi:MAG: hypothetical protein ACTSUV_04755 [Candidatus Ranarchaeia archaeon]